jgi:hypothetical protein
MSARSVCSVLAALVVSGCMEGGAPAPSEVVVLPVFSHVSGSSDHNFGTHPTGAEEVPPRDTQAQGQAIFTLNEDGTELSYKLIVANIDDVTQAHIHRAPAGVNGGIVVWLYPPAPPLQLIPGRSQGTLGEGVITDAEVIGSLAADGLEGLLDETRAGNAYVNVHTLEFPGGEIRGQLP